MIHMNARPDLWTTCNRTTAYNVGLISKAAKVIANPISDKKAMRSQVAGFLLRKWPPPPIPPGFWRCFRWTRSPALGSARARTLS